MLTLDNVHARHAAKKKEIEARLDEFAAIPARGDAALLSELSFCICAANSSAAAAGRAQQKLAASGPENGGPTARALLFSDDAPAISAVLLASHVRFHQNKAKYLIEARKKLFDEKGLEKALAGDRMAGTARALALRNLLADEILGLGMKEAGHFLRNAGLASNFAILDRHILKNLVSLRVVGRLPKTLTKKRYLAIEKKMWKFCEKAGIPMAHLDLLMWSEQTGRIFK